MPTMAAVVQVRMEKDQKGIKGCEMITLIYDLVIGVDTNNYTVMLDKHKCDKNGKPIYEKLGYYGTLAGAVDGARKYCIRKQLGSEIHTLTDAIVIMKSITEEFSALLKVVKE